jgi:MFS family permease
LPAEVKPSHDGTIAIRPDGVAATVTLKRLHPAWRILALAFLAVVLPAAVRGLLSILAVPVEAEHGWGRWVVSMSAGVSMLLFGVLGPFVAGAVGRFGSRRVMLCGLALMVGSMAVAPFAAASPWTFILVWGVGAGLGAGLLGIVFGASVVDRWFTARRGLAMGILSASIATAQLVVLPPAALLVQAVGWRGGVLVAGTWAALTFVAALRWMRDGPETVGQRPYGEGPTTPPVAKAAKPTGAGSLRVLGQSVRQPRFWLLALPFFVCGLTTGGLIAVHLVPASLEHGMPEVAAAMLLSTIGVFDFVGSLLSGWLSDRWHNGRLLAIYYGIRAVSLLGLPTALAAGAPALVVFALVYGLGWVATVPPTVRLCRTTFGADGPAVFGWLYAIHQVGAATAAVGAGLLHDAAGSYTWAFYAASAMAFGATLLSLAIRVPVASGVAPVAAADAAA